MECEMCEARIPVPERQGRPRRYCSRACQQKAYRRRIQPIPDVMTSRPRWVRWEAQERRGRTAKVPLTVFGTAASVTDPRTWTTYEKARAGGPQVGIVLGDGLGCIDLDHCVVDGVVAPWAKAIVDQHRDEAYLIERSMSGTGLHVFLPMAEARGRRIRDGGVNIEIYSRERYIAVTGDRLF